MQLHKIPKVSLILHTVKKTDTDGYIYVRVVIPDTRRYVIKSLGHKIPVNTWDPENEIVTRKHPDASRLNDLCNTYVRNLRKLLDDEYQSGAFFTKQHIEDLLDPNRSGANLVAFFRNYVAKFEPATSGTSPTYFRSFTTSFNTFVRFAGNSVPFSRINGTFLDRYRVSMTNSRTKAEEGKPLANNTRFLRMRHLKEVLDAAAREGHIKLSQYAHYNWPAYKSPDKKYLVLSQTDALWTSIVNGEYDHNPLMKEVACYFLVECYSGLRFSDWSRFTVETIIDRPALKVRARKNGEPVYLYLDKFVRLARLIEYIQQHNITFSASEPTTNRILKRIAAHQRIPINLTTHIGRHTFGTFLAALGYSSREIADHMGITEDVAKVYAKNTGMSSRSAQERLGGI